MPATRIGLVLFAFVSLMSIDVSAQIETKNPIKAAEVAQKNDAAHDADAFVVNLKDSLDYSVFEAMRTVIRQHPEAARWSGTSGNRIFSIVTLNFPDDQNKNRLRQALMSECSMRVVADLLKIQSLLTLYKPDRLDDATTLQTAIANTAMNLESRGQIHSEFKQITSTDQFVLGIIVADRNKISAVLSGEAEKAMVKNAYRNIMHQKARLLMEKEQWDDALGFWRHLHERQIVSARLYLDAATCFAKLGRISDSAKIASEALENYADLDDSEFYEKLGDLLLADTKNEKSQTDAEKAYNIAIERFSGNRTNTER